MDDWIADFPELAQLPADLRAELARDSLRVTLSAGTRLFGPGQPADRLLLLLRGRVRVTQTSESGREVVLYRVGAGESCVLTSACMLAYDDLAAEGLAETEITAIAIPRATFDGLVARSPVFRAFIFRAYSRRISDLLGLIEGMSFQRVDVRLAARLIALEEDGQIRATHQTLATELGTAREVVSRALAEFQRRDWIGQGRGRIRILDHAALAAQAEANVT